MRIIEHMYILTQIKVSKFISSLLIALIQSTNITSFLLGKQYIHGFSSKITQCQILKGGEIL